MLGDEFAKKIAEALKSNSTIVKIGESGLNLRNNTTGEIGWMAKIAEALKSNSTIVKMLKISCLVTSLPNRLPRR